MFKENTIVAIVMSEEELEHCDSFLEQKFAKNGDFLSTSRLDLLGDITFEEDSKEDLVWISGRRVWYIRSMIETIDGVIINGGGRSGRLSYAIPKKALSELVYHLTFPEYLRKNLPVKDLLKRVRKIDVQFASLLGIPQPPTAYQLYSQSVRREILDSQPIFEVLQLVAVRWADSQSIREEYFKKEREEKKKFYQELDEKKDDFVVFVQHFKNRINMWPKSSTNRLISQEDIVSLWKESRKP